MINTDPIVKTRSTLPLAISGLANRQDVRLILYGGHGDDVDVAALVHGSPDATQGQALVRIHSACLTGDVFGSMRCDCGPQLHAALEAVGQSDFGVLLYFLKHEGRGIGLLNKLRAYALQDDGLDTVDANLALGLPAEGRSFHEASKILSELGVSRVRLLTNNPLKAAIFDGTNVGVDELVPLEIAETKYSARYLKTKRERMGHLHRTLAKERSRPTTPTGSQLRDPHGEDQENPPTSSQANGKISKRRTVPADLESTGHFAHHRAPVASVCAVPERDWIVSGGHDCAVAVFDRADDSVRLLGYHDHIVNFVAAEPTGRLAASCSSDYSIRIWDLENSREVRSLLGHSDDVESFVFLGEGVGASASRDRRILVWDLRTGTILRVIEGHEKDVLQLAYHDGILFSASEDGTVRAWNGEHGGELAVFGSPDLEICSQAIDATRGRAFLGGRNGRVRCIDLRTGDTDSEWQAHRLPVSHLAVCPASGDVLTTADDGKASLWRSGRRDFEIQLDHPVAWNRSIRWNADGSTLLAGTFEGSVAEWDSKTGRRLPGVGNHSNRVGNPCFNSLSVAANGLSVFSSDEGRIRTVKVPRSAKLDTPLRWGKEISVSDAGSPLGAIAIDPSGSWIAAADRCKGLYIVSAKDDRPPLFLNSDDGRVTTVAFRPHDATEPPTLLLGHSTGIISEFSVSGTQLARDPRHPTSVNALCLRPDLDLAVSAAEDGSIRSWRPRGEVYTEFLSAGARVNDIHIEPDGRRVASVGRDFALSIHSLDSGALLERFALGPRSLKSACFYDAENVFVGDYWGYLIRVNLRTGQIRRARIAENGLSTIQSAGNSLLASSYDGGIYRFAPDDLDPIDTLKAMQQRLSNVPDGLARAITAPSTHPPSDNSI